MENRGVFDFSVTFAGAQDTSNEAKALKDWFTNFLDELFGEDKEREEESERLRTKCEQDERLADLLEEQERLRREAEELKQQLGAHQGMDHQEKLLRDLLRVRYDATEEEIELMYRKLAVKLHPDKNPGDPNANAKFKRMARAYEILKQKVRKRQ